MPGKTLNGGSPEASVVVQPANRDGFQDGARQPAPGLDAVVSRCSRPPGYGKSTMLAQWSEREDRPFAWVACGAEDPRGLCVLIGLALAQAGVVDRSILASVRARRAPGPALRELIAAFRSLECPTVLVLDDVHMLRSKGSADVVAALALDVPNGSAVVLAGRSAAAGSARTGAGARRALRGRRRGARLLPARQQEAASGARRRARAGGGRRPVAGRPRDGRSASTSPAWPSATGSRAARSRAGTTASSPTTSTSRSCRGSTATTSASSSAPRCWTSFADHSVTPFWTRKALGESSKRSAARASSSCRSTAAVGRTATSARSGTTSGPS